MDEHQEKVVCPLCGAQNYVDPDVSEDLKDDYLESILAGVPFTRTYDIMDGRIAVEVSAQPESISGMKSRLYMAILSMADKFPEVRNYVPTLEAALDLDCQLVSLEVFDKAGNSLNKLNRTPAKNLEAINRLPWREAKTSEECLSLMEDAINIGSDVFPEYNLPKAVLRGVVGKHNVIVMKLIKACLDENFLSGTGR
jgi:hypothetical protein